MYNINNQQFVYKQSSGKVFNFYFDEKLGLCYSNLSKRNTWGEPVVLQKNIHNNFFMEMDHGDNFHIIYQDLSGNIFYSHMSSGGNIKTIPVLGSKSVSAYNKYFSVVPIKEAVHFFYILKHNDSLMLVHQILAGGKAENPKVIDYVYENIRPYSVSEDNQGNIYTFYQSSDNKFYQLGYKKYTAIQRFWGEFIPITHTNADNEFPWTIIDEKNTIHLCYQRCSSKQYELVYQQKVPDRNIWSDEKTIHTSSYPFHEASIAYIASKLTIFWVRDDVIFYSSSNDYGSSWSKPSKHNSFTAGRQLMCARFKTNAPAEYDQVTATRLPGSFLNGLKLAFYTSISDYERSNLSAEELKNMIVDSLKLLRASIDELRDSDNSIIESNSKLSASIQSLERDFVKYTVRAGSIESELKQFKQRLEKFDEYKDLLEELRMQKNNIKPLKDDSSSVDMMPVIVENLPPVQQEHHQGFKTYVIDGNSKTMEKTED